MKLQRISLETINSTNTYAKENASGWNPSEITVVSAGQQTAGRGRFQRPWHSPANENVYVSYVFFIPLHDYRNANISQGASLAVIDMLRENGIPSALIKWPNDILINHRKISGILVETFECQQKLCVVAGIGINVNSTANELAAISQPATSMFCEVGHTFSIEEIIENLSKKMISFIEQISDNHPDTQGKYLKSLIHKQGDPIFVGGSLAGTFLGIAQDGALLYLKDDGTESRLHSGEIHL